MTTTRPRFKNGPKAASRPPENSEPLGPPLRAALYARVSTIGQKTIPQQLEALRRYADQRGWSVVAELSEIASGAKIRPQKEAIMKLARQREVDVVVVWRLDRWGRSVADLAVSLKELHELGVAFVSFTEALDLTTPSGRAMAALLAVFAEFEREVLKERIVAGIASARANGKRIGRPPIHRGKIQRVKQMSREGLSPRKIALELKISRTQVRRYLKVGGRPNTAVSRTNEVFALRAEGLSPRKIALRLGIGRTSVRRILHTATSE